MEKLTKLKSFMFDKAQYQVVDRLGNTGLLKVNYKDKKFEIMGDIESDSKKELTEFANTILDKKHGVNFANVS